jgi:hypothetical protein
MGDTIYVGSTLGRFYASSHDGARHWDYVTRPPNSLLEAIPRRGPRASPFPMPLALPSSVQQPYRLSYPMLSLEI